MKQFYNHVFKLTASFLMAAFCFAAYAQPGAVTKVLPLNVTQTGNGNSTVNWVNPANATNENGVTASVTVSNGNEKKSATLNISNFGFTLGTNPGDIPTNASISGIKVEIRKKATGSVKDQTIKMLKANNPVGGVRNLPGAWPATLSYTSHGSVTDLWGTTWTPAQIASSGFGVQVQVMNMLRTNSIAEVDNIKITIYYNLNIYYSKSTGSLSHVATWGLNTNGSGANPPNFTTDGQIFNLVNRTTTALDADLTITGLYSKIIVGNGDAATSCTIPANYTLTALTDVSDLSTLVIQNTTLPTLGALDINSTVNYNAGGNQDVAEADYGHLTISGSGSKTLLSGALGASSVSGNLSISSVFTVDHPIYVYGNISNTGNTNGTSSITVTGDVTSTLGGGGTFRSLTIDKDVENGNGASFSSNVLINEWFYCASDTIANNNFLIPQPGSTIQIEDGRLLNNITSTNAYNVLYTGAGKTNSFETTGSGLKNITINLDDNSYAYTPSSINMSGDLILSSGNFSPAASTIGIGGDLINNAVFTPGTSTISFINATHSNVYGSSATSFYNLTINKTSLASQVAMSNDITVANQLTLANGTLNLGTYTLLQGGAIARTAGAIHAALGTVEMKGSTAQTIPAGTFVNNALDKLIISNTATGVSLAGAVDIYTSVSFGNVSNKALNSAGFLTLKSSAAKTAAVNDLTNDGNNSGNSITGNVTVERHIPAGRKWRFLAIPTQGSQTFKQAWQENNVANGNNNPGYGMMVTDQNSATWSANGFDAHSIGGPTVKYYDAATNKWIGISSTALPISNNIGYMSFVRGNRGVVSTNTTTSETVLRTTGVLKQGTQTAIAVPSNTMASVGNPYASPIDMRKISKPGVQEFFYVWDPALSGSYGVGGYQTFSKIGNDYVVTPGGGSYGSIGAVNNFIQSGQAFFVKGAAGGTVDFKETDKPSQNAPGFASLNGEPESFRANLLIPSGNTYLMADGILVDYHTMYSNAVDYDDAPKFLNSNENVGLRRDGSLLMIERRYAMSNQDTLYLNITGMRVQAYRWTFTGIDIAAAGRMAFLVDNFTNTRTTLNLEGITNLDFNVTGVAASSAYNRFMIVFEQASVVPVTLTSVSAKRNNDKSIEIKWQVENEIAIEKYEVERSGDGGNFSMINKSMPSASANGMYTYTDFAPLATDNYYRVKATSLSGLVQYSAIIKVKPLANAAASISVYPTLVSDKKINIALQNQPKGNYNIQVAGLNGQVVYKGILVQNTHNTVHSIALNIAAGMYTVSISNLSETQTTKIIVE